MSSTRQHVSTFLASVKPLGGLFSAAAALIAATLVVANVAVQSKMSALENELGFYKSTKSVNVPILMHELQEFVGPAKAKLKLSKLKVEFEALKADHSKIKTSYEALKKSTRLTERFSLKTGQAKPILNGKYVAGVNDIHPGRIYATFNDVNTDSWSVGEYGTAKIDGIEYRIMLEEIGGVAVFRVDEMPLSKAKVRL
jgi:hypothetical protein